MDQPTTTPSNHPGDVAPPTPQQPLKPIDAADFKAIPEEEKPTLMGGVHANIMVQPPIEKAMHECRLLGYAKARADGVPENEVVAILAHNDTHEVFFKDHPKLDDAQRARMIKALSPEETLAYEVLVETERREMEPEKIVAARAARVAYECEWATERWRWKRYAHYFIEGPDGKRAVWATWFTYRSILAEDPITLDPEHPWTGIWNDMTKLVPAGDGVRSLVIAGNMSSAHICVFDDEEEAPLETSSLSAEEYAESLKT